MNISIELLKRKIASLPDSGNERSFYPALCNFLEGYGKETLKLRDPQAVAEETLSKDDKSVGFPDITLRNGQALVGWIEVKLPKDRLDNEKFKFQFEKYKDSLENIVFTNLKEWELWRWAKDEGDSKIESRQITKIHFDLTQIGGVDCREFENFLAKFFEGRAHETRTPKQLALALAKKTRLLSKQVEEALDMYDSELDLSRLKETFEKTLIQDISPHQFANMVSETLAYSLFLAVLEHSRRNSKAELTLTNAIDYLPTNVPILADLYSLVKKVAITIPSITDAARLLVDQLNASDIERIRQKLVEHKPGEDPVIQFYEPFLQEYDPKERELRGVYYTPKPVVDYIVKSVDVLLRDKFGKERGLADESVHLLDPATGTGTFLMSAIQQIYSDLRKQNESQGELMVQKAFNDSVLRHILKHFYGFELLIAPYAVAHLKLTLEVERLGFDFALTRNDGDKDNDRFKVYLSNALDDPNQPPEKLLVGYTSIPQESESARKVKSDLPILAIIGNPPYSNFGGMNRGEWILDLLKDYKKGLNERKINLDDDFIKFIRFAQWKLEKTGQGIFAMITSNTFVDGITHRQMRRSLMDTFDEIYIYNLRGNSRKGEVSPNGDKDENVFNIQQGVSINIFVRSPEKKIKSVVKYCDLWGSRDNKFKTLLEEDFSKTDWRILAPKSPNWFFTVKDTSAESEYMSFLGIKDIFPAYSGSGVITRNDDLAIQFDKETIGRIVSDFGSMSILDLREKYQIKDGASWKLDKAKKDVLENAALNKILKIQYRPFDYRWTLYTQKSGGFLNRPVFATMKQLLKSNLALATARIVPANQDWNRVLVSANITDIHAASDQTYLFPLYRYMEHGFLKSGREPNISPDAIQEVTTKTKLTFVGSGRGDLENTFGPEDIFYYIYAILHSPTYRMRYAEQLKIDFPRFPITSDKQLFKRLIAFGNELVNLHLLGENPFDSSKTILDEPSHWGIKIGGQAPPNMEDWKVSDVRYHEKEKRIYVNSGQYFEGVERDVWRFMVGGYQVCEKWLKDRKKAARSLSTDDLQHYMKIMISVRGTIRLMDEIDKIIPSWPLI